LAVGLTDALARRRRADPARSQHKPCAASACGVWSLVRMSATFIFLMVFLKLPIFGLLYIVWWAIRATPEPDPATDEDGGTKRPREPSPRHPHPRPALPRHPRRGPHGAPPVPAPPRARTVVARARRVEH
jgi:hypothetical protein